MATILRSKRCRAALATLACAVACGAPPTPVTAVAIPDAPRRPDGVVLEPTPAVPEVEESAAPRGVVALREPLGGEAVVTVVHQLVRAFEREDADALAALLTDDAALLGSAAVHGPRGSVLDLWRARLKNLDYTRLGGSEVVREDRIERFTYADLGAPGAPERPQEMKAGDLLLRVPVATPRVGPEQLFGDVVVLLLRREGRGFKIAGFGEENGP